MAGAAVRGLAAWGVLCRADSAGMTREMATDVSTQQAVAQVGDETKAAAAGRPRTQKQIEVPRGPDEGASSLSACKPP
jgi:hypothetical protein